MAIQIALHYNRFEGGSDCSRRNCVTLFRPLNILSGMFFTCGAYRLKYLVFVKLLKLLLGNVVTLIAAMYKRPGF